MNSSQNSCNDIQRMISDGIDAPLPPDAALRVKVHLTSCAECAAFERSTRHATTSVAALPWNQGSPQVRDNVMAAVYRSPDARPVGWHGWARQGLQLAGAGLAFALVAVVLMAVIGSNRNDENGGPTRGGSFGSDTSIATPTVDATSTTAVPDASGATVGACQPGQVSFEASTETSSLGDGDNPPTMTILRVDAIKESGGAACYLETDVTISLRDASGQPLDIEGNEQTSTLRGIVPYDAPSTMFAWDNWCGADNEVSLHVEGAGTASELVPIPLPTCMSAEVPSTLGQAAMAEPSQTDPMMGNSCGSWFAALSNEEFPDDAPPGTIALWIGEGFGEECGNNETWTLTIQDTMGQPLDIENNPMEVSLEPSTEDPNFGVIGILWSNWCGDAQEVSFEIRGESSGSGGSLSPLPTCEDPAQPSTLTITTDVPQSWEELPPVAPSLAPSDLEPCAEGDVNLSMTTVMTDDVLQISPMLIATDEPCWMAGDLIVTIQDANGKRLDILDNPTKVAIYSDIERVEGDAWFTWSNWCRDPMGAQVAITLNDLSTVGLIETTPACTDMSQPTTLTTFPGSWEPSSEVSVTCEDIEMATTNGETGQPATTPSGTEEAGEDSMTCVEHTPQPVQKEPTSAP